MSGSTSSSSGTAATGVVGILATGIAICALATGFVWFLLGPEKPASDAITRNKFPRAESDLVRPNSQRPDSPDRVAVEAESTESRRPTRGDQADLLDKVGRPVEGRWIKHVADLAKQFEKQYQDKVDEATPQTLQDFASHLDEMVSLRKFQLVEKSVRLGFARFLPNIEHEVRVSSMGDILMIGTAARLSESGGEWNTLVWFPPDEFPDIAELRRQQLEMADAVTQDLIGNFNNLPYDTRKAAHDFVLKKRFRESEIPPHIPNELITGALRFVDETGFLVGRPHNH